MFGMFERNEDFAYFATPKLINQLTFTKIAKYNYQINIIVVNCNIDFHEIMFLA